MSRRIVITSVAAGLLALGIAFSAFAQEPKPPAAGPGGQVKGKGGGKGGATRPPLFFREDWKQTAAGGEHEVVPEDVSNPNLELKLYGAPAKQILVTGAANDDNNPVHVWTGTCESVCSIALKEKNNFVDLTGLARIKWVTKVSGIHQVHPILKLADGTWVVGDHADGSSSDWHENEFSLSEVHWARWDVDKGMSKSNWIQPDLSKVDEIGFTDLMAGSGHGPGGWSDVGKIEVYGKPVPR